VSGPLAAGGTHCLDQIRWFMIPQCGEITRAESIVNRKVYNGPHDETALLTYQFENGSTAELCASVLYNGPGSWSSMAPTAMRSARRPSVRMARAGSRPRKAASTIPPANPYVGEIEDFAAAIRDGRHAEVGGREGAANVDLLLRAVGV
jgi:predicted dehydrogenase